MPALNFKIVTLYTAVDHEGKYALREALREGAAILVWETERDVMKALVEVYKEPWAVLNRRFTIVSMDARIPTKG